jgi:hypothetical protein
MANDCAVDVNKMQAIASIEGDDPEDTKLLREMAVEAHDFMSSHEWCKHLDSLHLAYGIGGVVAVFFAQMTPHSVDVDKCLWVIVGNLPPAYIVVDDNPTAALVLWTLIASRWRLGWKL